MNINDIRARERLISYSNFINLDGPREKLHFTNRANGPTEFYLYNVIGGYDGIASAEVVQALGGIQGDIDLHINSIGGSIFEGSAIYNAFNNYRRGTVNSIVDGVAASAASWVAQAGKHVAIERNATMMVHDGAGGVGGTPKELREQADLLDKLSNSMAETYARRTGNTATAWRKIMQSGDTWYNAAEAVKAKLADAIAGDEDPGNVLDLGLLTAAAPIADLPPTIDVEGLRNALKGVFA